jgi:hypothetical protein
VGVVAVPFLVVAVFLWLAALFCMLRARRPFRFWMRPLIERGEIPPAHGAMIPVATWLRLYGSRPEPDPGAEALRLEARRWHGRFLGSGVLFALCVLLAWVA